MMINSHKIKCYPLRSNYRIPSGVESKLNDNDHNPNPKPNPNPN